VKENIRLMIETRIYVQKGELILSTQQVVTNRENCDVVSLLDEHTDTLKRKFANIIPDEGV